MRSFGGGRGDLVAAALAAALVFLMIWPIARQGLSLLDDGVWLLGAERLLHGKTLYRDIFTIYGPAQFVILAAFFKVIGTSAGTLALVKALAAAVAGGAGIVAARRLGAHRSAALVPLAVVALGVLPLKTVWAAVLTLIWGLLLRHGLHRQRALAMGCAWGTLAWFGLDAALSAAVVVILSTSIMHLMNRGDLIRLRLLAPMAASFAGVIAVPIAWALVTGSLSDFAWNTLAYPIFRFRGEMSVPLFETLFGNDRIGTPFATLFTGEALGAKWPAHATLRALSLRLLCLVVFSAPVAALLIAWRRARDPLLISLAAFASASLLPLAVRADEQHLLSAALGSLALGSVAVARFPRRLAAIALFMALISFGPLFAEKVWLNLNRHRDTLAQWHRGRAQIALAATRVGELERNLSKLPGGLDTPTAFWPYQPALNFLFDIPLAHRQVTLLGGEIRDTASFIDELRLDPPPRVVLVERDTLDGRTMRSLVPELWGHLRTHYRVVDRFVGTADPAWILLFLPRGWEEVAALPLNERLPDKQQNTGNGWSCDLSRGTRIMQSFPVDDVDLSGFQVQWLSKSAGFTAQVELVVWAVDDERPLQPLHGFRVAVDFDQGENASLISFDPVAGTRGRKVAVELRIPGGTPAPVHLLWHSHGGGDDLFREGQAFVDGVPIEADLHFASF